MNNNAPDIDEKTLTNRQIGISADCSNCLKGIFAVCVLIHHLYQHSGLLHQTVIEICLQAAGYLSVACFFFLSGYGLYASYQEEGEPYVKNFPKRKIVPFYCLILLFSLIYFVEGILLGQVFSAEILLKSFAFGGTVIGNGWYLQVQLVLYLFFFVTFRMVKDSKQCIIWIFGECLLFCVFLYALGYGSTWYESVFAFTIGMIWRETDHYTVEIMKNKFVCFMWGGGIEFVLVCIAFVGFYLMNNSIVALIFKMTSAVFFSVFIATAINLIHVENRITRWLGKYSTEIYVVQGLFLSLFHSQMIYLENSYLYVFAVTVTVFVSAVVLHPITRRIYSITREYLK